MVVIHRMDKKLERSNSSKVLRKLAVAIKQKGFIRAKPTFFTRESGLIIEFIHIHKYSFGPCFRLHVCLRVLNEDKSSISLAGPVDRELCEGISFEFGEADETLDSCVVKMTEFVDHYAEPWFTHWRNATLLLGEGSPLYPAQKAALEDAIQGRSIYANALLSRRLLM